LTVLSLGLSIPQVAVRPRNPPVYYDSGTIPATASQAFAVDNGMYDVLVEGATKEWKRIFVVTGSYTVTPANNDPTFTRARFFGPYGLTPDTGDAVGAALFAGAVLNSIGHATYGKSVIRGNRVTRASQSAQVANVHQGWANGGGFYWTFDSGTIEKRNKTDGVLIDQNDDAFDGLTGGADHLGGGKYYDGVLYNAACLWTGLCSSANGAAQIALYDATAPGLPFLETHAVDVAGDISGLAINPDAGENGEIYVVRFCENTTILRVDLSTFEALPPITLSGTPCDSFQDIAYNPSDGRLYITGQREGAGTKSILVVERSGQIVAEILPTDWSNAMEGIDFENGQIGVLNYDAGPTGVSFIDFYAVPTPATNNKAGYLNEKQSFLRFVDCPLPDAFTVFQRYTPTTVNFNFNVIWDNTVWANKYEVWIASNSNVRGRINNTTQNYTNGAVAGTAMTVSYAANKADLSVALYQNNADRDTTAESSWFNWPSGGDFCLGGGHGSNTAGDGLHGYCYLFNRKLTLGEKQALEASPGRIWLPTNALTTAQKTAIAAGGY
jgi:hypothetical protein